MRESTVISGWMAEGRLEEQRGALLEILQARFRIGIPPELAAAIQQNPDSDELRRWLILAATVDSLDAFRAAVQRP